MKARSVAAFTKLDLLVVVGSLVMLAIWFLYAQRGRFGQPRTSRLGCVSNLKQVGLGFRMWANDHGDRFPWQVRVADFGTREFARLPYASLHYLAASNELNTPKILTCPNDAGRPRSNSWDAPLHLGLSYFAGLNADATKPSTILAGDRNVATNSSAMVGLLTVRNVNELQVAPGLHQTFVNVGLADGSVAQLKPADLRKAARAEMTALSNQPVWLVIP